MKYLKMLAITAIVSMGLMAFVGAGTASATTLFTDKALTTHYPPGTEIHATLAASSSLTAGGSTINTCPESTVAGKTSNTTGTTITGMISVLTWSNNCTATTHTIALGELSIEKTGANEGKVVGKGSQVTVVMFGASCTYGTGTGTTLGTITGGTAPVLNINTVSLTRTAGGFLCPSTAGWHAEYVFTVPHALYIGA